MAVKKLWNDNWEFCECPLEDQYYEIPKDANWESVDIPHDWMIYDTRNLYRDSIGWYRKKFYINHEQLQHRTSLRFDGVYMDSTVFINGKQAYEWKYGYSTFEFDITEFLHEGLNEVLVRVVYQHSNSRWYSGAGIYRNVWIKTYQDEHLLADGVYITTVPLENGVFRVEIETEIHISPEEKGERILRQTIYDPNKEEVASISMPYSPEKSIRKISATPDSQEAYIFFQYINIEKPLLWDIGQGNVYALKTELIRDNEVIEIEENRFGFRVMTFDTHEGFFINGRNVKLNGVCEHHDLGCLGAAFNKDAMRRKFEKLRTMGVNAIRTAHNMPAPEVMELADELGFLVISEAFDMWEMSKTPYDYGRFFKEWCERDVRSWIRRDRNCPSLLMWSIGNEIYDTQASEYGQEITKRLISAVREHDPKKNAPITIGSNFMKWENAQACSKLVDIIGYNYGEDLYDEHHEKHPDWIIYGSETSSMLASRGIYHFPLERSILTDEDEQCSALGNSVTGWGAMSYEEAIFDDRDAKYSLGQFIWTGFDYIGEPTPYKTKNSYFGQFDTAGFPKDSYYIFCAEWTSYKDNPMIHIFPYWDFNPGQTIDVQVCTNAPACELFFNGKSLGRREIDHKRDRKTVQHWKIPYQPGKLIAVAYDEKGRIIASDTKESFGDTKSLIVKADKEVIRANGTDLLFLEVQAVDENGIPVENAKDRINVMVTGAGRLVGLDNGDSADFDQYKGRSRRLFSGKLLIVIAAKTEPGDICVTLESVATGKMELHYTAISCEEKIEGVQATMENQDRQLVGCGSAMPDLPAGTDEVPIRKIELSFEGNNYLTPQNPSVIVKSKIYPANATYRDLEWKVLNQSGIKIDYVDIEPVEDGVRLRAKADGEFRIRCITKNGGGCASVISELPVQAEGFGNAYLNPYKDIPAGLYDVRRGGAMEGIEHGIGFTGNEAGVVGYSYIDFGPYGTEEITLSIFANTNDPVYFKLWEGDPDDGGELLLDAKYHIKHEWMVFKDMTYRLNKRLRGKKAIYITTNYFFTLKSFVFTEEKKAFSVLQAADCDSVYGDEFTYKDSCIENIGNNVLLEFEDMDFGDEGTDAITICGSSPLEKSIIQIRFTCEGETSVQMVEFVGCQEYTEQRFSLEKVTGKCKVAFIFLPGSNFNFSSFQFHKASGREV